MTTIGQNIRKLRKDRGWTQEELAAKLNLSAQAVSKWESEVTSPDISQVIPLTALFGVSADVLFGIRPDGMEEEIAEAKRICDLPETSNERAFEIWTELSARYPHNNRIRFELALVHQYLASADEPREVFNQHYRDSAEIFEKILDSSTDSALRSDAIYHMHHCYNTLGDTANAVRTAEMSGNMCASREELLMSTKGYEKKNYYCQKVFRNHGEGMAWCLMGMTFPDRKTKIFGYETAVKILDLTYCDGDKAWISYVYIYLFTDLAKLYGLEGDAEKAFAYLEKSRQVCEFEDNNPLGEHRYSGNPFMNEITYNHDLAYTHNQRDYLLCHMEDDAFGFIRDTERFREFTEKVHQMPGIEYPWGEVDF